MSLSWVKYKLLWRTLLLLAVCNGYQKRRRFSSGRCATWQVAVLADTRVLGYPGYPGVPGYTGTWVRVHGYPGTRGTQQVAGHDDDDQNRSAGSDCGH
eukprot:728846-Rhodomonas_salina.3